MRFGHIKQRVEELSANEGMVKMMHHNDVLVCGDFGGVTGGRLVPADGEAVKSS